MVELTGSALSADTVSRSMSVNLLAMETSGGLCSVCLRRDGNVFSLTEHVEKSHNERLLPMLDALLVDAAIKPADLPAVLDTVAFGAGPGSFTGVRIAAAAAQALALVSSASVAAVSSCEALALAGSRPVGFCAGDETGGQETGGVVALIRSRRELFYLAAYELTGGEMVERLNPRLVAHSPPDDVYDLVAGYRVVGDCPPWWRGAAVLENVRAAASEVLDVATSMVALGRDVDPAEGLPVYLDGDSPWSKRTSAPSAGEGRVE